VFGEGGEEEGFYSQLEASERLQRGRFSEREIMKERSDASNGCHTASHLAAGVPQQHELTSSPGLRPIFPPSDLTLYYLPSVLFLLPITRLHSHLLHTL